MAGEPGQARAHATRERAGTGRRERRAGGDRGIGGVEHEQPRARIAGREPLDRGPGLVAAGHDHCRHRVAQRGRDRSLRAGLDHEVVHQRAGDPDHAVEHRGGLGVAGRVEGLGQGIGAGLPATGVGLGLAPAGLGRGEMILGLSRLRGGGFGVVVAAGRADSVAVRRSSTALSSVATVSRRVTMPATRASNRASSSADPRETVAPHRDLAAHRVGFGDRIVRRGERGELGPLLGEGALRGLHFQTLFGEDARLGFEALQLEPHRAGVGDERLDHAFVGGGRELSLQTAAPFLDQRAQTPRPLADRLDPRERVGDVAVADVGERAFRVEHRRRRARASAPGSSLPRVPSSPACSRRRVVFACSPASSRPDEVHADRAQLVDDAVVAAGRVGLLLERAQPAAHLAQQVVEADEVAFGRLEPPLGLLPALAVLEDAGGLLDDRAAVLRTGVEDRVELALADDHVLLATDTAVGEQLLDVEQAARRTVDRVLGVAVAEQRAGDRHLGELDRQQAGSCCRS